MKNYSITIDTGTTNTRAILWDHEGNAVASQSIASGVRDTAKDGNSIRLAAAVKSCLKSLLKKAGIGYEQIVNVAASGMITSNVGLTEVPHCIAPVGKKELAAASIYIKLEDVCPLPILFIPGIKNGIKEASAENFEAMDVMRGEEAECISLLDSFGVGRRYLFILPGSHTKLVSVDADGVIEGCMTTLSGELLSAVTNETIIADSVGRSYVTRESYDFDLIYMGYDAAKKYGTSRACFLARTLNQFSVPDKKKMANYICGVMIQNDIMAMQNTSAIKVSSDTMAVIGGSSLYCQALYDVLTAEGILKEVHLWAPKDGVPLSARGAYMIAKENRLEGGG